MAGDSPRPLQKPPKRSAAQGTGFRMAPGSQGYYASRSRMKAAEVADMAMRVDDAEGLAADDVRAHS